VTQAAFTVGYLPQGVEAPKTAADRKLYGAALDMEGVFTKSLVDAMMQSTGEEESSDGATSLYREMGTSALNDALVSSGGLGLAGSLYASMKEHS
jgi:Rod binding domain-containing protein